MDRPDIEGALARAEKATPGPWTWGMTKQEDEEGVIEHFREAYRAGTPGPVHLVCVKGPGEETFDQNVLHTAITGNGPTSEANAKFIRSARTDLPAICRWALEVEGELKESQRLFECTDAQLGAAQKQLDDAADFQAAVERVEGERLRGAVEAEREACAKVADELVEDAFGSLRRRTPDEIADAIRGRNERAEAEGD